MCGYTRRIARGRDDLVSRCWSAASAGCNRATTGSTTFKGKVVILNATEGRHERRPSAFWYRALERQLRVRRRWRCRPSMRLVPL